MEFMTDGTNREARINFYESALADEFALREAAIADQRAFAARLRAAAESDDPQEKLLRPLLLEFACLFEERAGSQEWIHEFLTRQYEGELADAQALSYDIEQISPSRHKVTRVTARGRDYCFIDEKFEPVAPPEYGCYKTVEQQARDYAITHGELAWTPVAA